MDFAHFLGFVILCFSVLCVLLVYKYFKDIFWWFACLFSREWKKRCKFWWVERILEEFVEKKPWSEYTEYWKCGLYFIVVFFWVLVDFLKLKNHALSILTSILNLHWFAVLLRMLLYSFRISNIHSIYFDHTLPISDVVPHFI